MVTVSIGSSQRPLVEAIQGGWIAEQFERQRKDRSAICVKVAIKTPGVDLFLVTPNCPEAGGRGGRDLTNEEKAIFELWKKRGLAEMDFTPGNVQAFLRQLSQLL